MKVRIKKLPKKAYGGQQADGALNVTPTKWGGNYAEAKQGREVKQSLTKIPRSMANLEAEGGETAFGPISGDTIPDHFNINGPRHGKGGVPLNLPEDTFIFSDTKAMRITDPAILKMFGKTPKKGGYTPAELAKPYDINKYKAILMDPETDRRSRETATIMIKNYIMKLGALALAQESKKGFPQGIPEMAKAYMEANGITEEDLIGQQQMQGQEPMMRNGGIRKFKPGGAAGTDPKILIEDINRITIDGALGENRANILKDGQPITGKASGVTVTSVQAVGDKIIVNAQMFGVSAEKPLGHFKKGSDGSYKFVPNKTIYDKFMDPDPKKGAGPEDQRLFNSFIEGVETNSSFRDDVRGAIKGTNRYEPKTKTKEYFTPVKSTKPTVTTTTTGTDVKQETDLPAYEEILKQNPPKVGQSKDGWWTNSTGSTPPFVSSGEIWDGEKWVTGTPTVGDDGNPIVNVDPNKTPGVDNNQNPTNQDPQAQESDKYDKYLEDRAKALADEEYQRYKNPGGTLLNVKPNPNDPVYQKMLQRQRKGLGLDQSPTNQAGSSPGMQNDIYQQMLNQKRFGIYGALMNNNNMYNNNMYYQQPDTYAYRPSQFKGRFGLSPSNPFAFPSVRKSNWLSSMGPATITGPGFGSGVPIAGFPMGPGNQLTSIDYSYTKNPFLKALFNKDIARKQLNTRYNFNEDLSKFTDGHQMSNEEFVEKYFKDSGNDKWTRREKKLMLKNLNDEVYSQEEISDEDAAYEDKYDYTTSYDKYLEDRAKKAADADKDNVEDKKEVEDKEDVEDVEEITQTVNTNMFQDDNVGPRSTGDNTGIYEGERNLFIEGIDPISSTTFGPNASNVDPNAEAKAALGPDATEEDIADYNETKRIEVLQNQENVTEKSGIPYATERSTTMDNSDYAFGGENEMLNMFVYGGNYSHGGFHNPVEKEPPAYGGLVMNNNNPMAGSTGGLYDTNDGMDYSNMTRDPNQLTSDLVNNQNLNINNDPIQTFNNVAGITGTPKFTGNLPTMETLPADVSSLMVDTPEKLKHRKKGLFSIETKQKVKNAWDVATDKLDTQLGEVANIITKGGRGIQNTINQGDAAKLRLKAQQNANNSQQNFYGSDLALNPGEISTSAMSAPNQMRPLGSGYGEYGGAIPMAAYGMQKYQDKGQVTYGPPTEEESNLWFNSPEKRAMHDAYTRWGEARERGSNRNPEAEAEYKALIDEYQPHGPIIPLADQVAALNKKYPYYHNFYETEFKGGEDNKGWDAYRKRAQKRIQMSKDYNDPMWAESYTTDMHPEVGSGLIKQYGGTPMAAYGASMGGAYYPTMSRGGASRVRIKSLPGFDNGGTNDKKLKPGQSYKGGTKEWSNWYSSDAAQKYRSDRYVAYKTKAEIEGVPIVDEDVYHDVYKRGQKQIFNMQEFYESNPDYLNADQWDSQYNWGPNTPYATKQDAINAHKAGKTDAKPGKNWKYKASIKEMNDKIAADNPKASPEELQKLQYKPLTGDEIGTMQAGYFGGVEMGASGKSGSELVDYIHTGKNDQTRKLEDGTVVNISGADGLYGNTANRQLDVVNIPEEEKEEVIEEVIEEPGKEEPGKVEATTDPEVENCICPDGKGGTIKTEIKKGDPCDCKALLRGRMQQKMPVNDPKEIPTYEDLDYRQLARARMLRTDKERVNPALINPQEISGVTTAVNTADISSQYANASGALGRGLGAVDSGTGFAGLANLYAKGLTAMGQRQMQNTEGNRKAIQTVEGANAQMKLNTDMKNQAALNEFGIKNAMQTDSEAQMQNAVRANVGLLDAAAAEKVRQKSLFNHLNPNQQIGYRDGMPRFSRFYRNPSLNPNNVAANNTKKTTTKKTKDTKEKVARYGGSVDGNSFIPRYTTMPYGN